MIQGISNYSPADYEELMKVASIKPLLGGGATSCHVHQAPPCPEVGEYLRKQSSALPQGPENRRGQITFVINNSFVLKLHKSKSVRPFKAACFARSGVTTSSRKAWWFRCHCYFWRDGEQIGGFKTN